MKNKIQKGLSYFSLFILALGMLPLGNILADEKVVPTKFVIEQNNLEANGFKIANDQVLTSEDVVKLSNVKSVDNLVDVNKLKVSDDQLANVNQVNPNGGLYNLTLTNGEQATITIPVVKEGNLVTANSKGALIFKNLALSQEANNKEKVLEETGVYSVAFNNGYVNSDLTVDINKNNTVVKDTNLGLSKELTIGSNVDDESASRSSAKINSQETINAAGETNPQEAIRLATENLTASIENSKEVRVENFSQLETQLKNVSGATTIVIDRDIVLERCIKITNNNVTINMISQNGSKLIISRNIAGGEHYFELIGSIQTLNLNDLNIMGEASVDSTSSWTWQNQPKITASGVFGVFGKNNTINSYNVNMANIRFSDVTGHGSFIGLNWRYGDPGNVQGMNIQANVYGGTFKNLTQRRGVIGVNNGTYRQFGGSFSEAGSTWQGTLLAIEGRDNYMELYGGEVVNNKFANQYGQSSVILNNNPSNLTPGMGVRTKIYGNFIANDSNLVNGGGTAGYDAPQRGNGQEKLQPANIAALYYNTKWKEWQDQKTYEQQKLINITPSTNLSFGTGNAPTWYAKYMEDIFADRQFLASQMYRDFGGYPLFQIEYTDPRLRQMYENNGVAEGIYSDWNVGLNASNSITKTGGFNIVEVTKEGRHYAVLTKSYTTLEVITTTNAESVNDDLGAGYTTVVPSNYLSLQNTPQVEGKTPISIDVISNELIQGTLPSSGNAAIAGFEGDNNEKFHVNPKNPVQDGNTYRMKVRIVYEEETNLKIDAQSAVIKQSEAINNSSNIEAYLKNVMKVVATKNGKPSNDISITPVIISGGTIEEIKIGKLGTYQIKFIAMLNGESAEVVKNLTIVDENTEISPDKSKFLSAKNFTVTEDEAKALTETAAKNKAEVKAGNADGTDLTPNVAVDPAQLAKIKKGVVGSYPLKFTVDELEKTVYVTVTDEYTVVGDKAAIKAKNFRLVLNAETASLTADIAKEKAEADAWYLDGHTPKPTINVNEAQLNAIKATTKAGVMDLTFTVADDPNATRTVKVTILDNSVRPDNVFLAAYNFTITDEEAKALTEAAAKQKARVNAFQPDGTNLTSNVVVDAAQLAKIKEGVAGGYPLKFSIAGVVEKTVTVTVTDEYTVVGDKAAIRAKNFKLKLNAETASLTADIAKDKAEADAWYLNGHTPKPTINVDEAQLNAIKAANKVGVMDLTFTVADDAKATRTVKVNIYDDNTTISPDESKFLHAKDFTITDEEAKALTEAAAKDKAGVKAWNADGTDLTPNVAVDPAQLAKIKEGVAGGYPLKFFVDGLERTVNVTVTDENTICEGNVCITANSFTHNLTDVAQLDEAEAIKKAGARAWYTDSVDTKPTLKVNQQELANIQQTKVAKVFPLTFTTVENPNVSKQVDVTVTDNSFELTANNITIDLATAKNYTNTKLIEDTKAKAVRKDNSGNGTVLVTSGLDAINQTTKAGLFPVTLSVKEDPNTTKQVFITVTDENTVVGDKAAITAKNFKLKLNTETASLTADIAKTKAEADAWYLDGHTPKPTINVDEAQLNAIKAANNVGVMDLTFTVADNTKATGTVARTVKVTIYDDNTEITPDKFLHAKDFTITDEEAKALTESTAKDKAGVKAWNVDGTDLTPNVAVDPAQLAKIKEGVAGAYPLKFTVDGLEKTVNVTVTTNTIILPGLDNKPGTPDDVVVKPKPDQNGNYPKPNPDGSVTLPGGGEITIPGTGNGDITIAPPGSTIKPDGTITTPSGNEVRPNPEGGVELPGQDGSITNKPQDNPLVKPNGNGPITVNPDGSVTLPPNENGTITFPNNPDNNGVTNFPGGSTIKPDGTVITPNGNQVRPNPLGGVELPGIDGSITNKPQDNPVVKSEGNGPITINPDGSVTLPPNENGTVTFPNGNNNGVTNIPGGSTIKPDGTVVTPNGGEVRPNPEGGVELPGLDGSITNKPQDNPLVKPNGNGPITVNPDGSVTLPNDQNGTITFPNNPDNNNEITFPNGSNIGQNGQVTPPGGSPVLPNANGTITIPGADGNLGTPDDGIVTPNGNSTINPDGSLTLPGGGTVDLPGCQLTVEPGGVVLPNGAVINPGANGVLDTPGYAPQAPGTDNKTNTRAMANNEQANQGQQDATNQPNGNNTANSNVNDDVYLDPTIVCATPVVKPTTQPTAKPQTPTGAASQVVLYATIIAAAVGSIVVIRRNRK